MSTQPGLFLRNRAPLTRDEAVKLVLSRNPGVAQARAAIAASRANTASIKSAYLPGLNISASYMNVGPNQVFDIPHLGSFALFPMNNYDIHLGASYLLYDFGKRDNAVAAAQVAETSGVESLENLRKNLAYVVMRLFDNIVLQEKNVAVQDEDIADREHHLDVVKKKVETGSATSFDALRAEQQLDAARSERIDAADVLADLRTSLRELLGLLRTDSLRLREDSIPAQPRLDADSLMVSAMKNRSDYKVALAAKEAARLHLRSAKLENMPVLGVSATGGYKNGIIPNINTFQSNWTAGAEVSMPIFDGRRAKNHVAEAELNVEAADAGLANLSLQISTDVLHAKSDAEAAFSKLAMTETQVTLAQKALSLAHIQYEAGAITNLDVLDAEKDYAQAKLAYLAGQYQCLLDLYRLDQVTGTIYKD